MTENQQTDLLSGKLKELSQTGRVSHAYILEGMLSETLPAAEAFAKTLADNAADILLPEHEKPNLFSVEDVRAGINGSVNIRPYGGGKKVYIVREAEKMNPQAQNALLKTIEEPPEYVVILLLTENSDSFLQTILSRCVLLSGSAVSAEKKEEENEAFDSVKTLLSRSPVSTQDVLDFVKAMNDHKGQAESVLEYMRTFFRDVLACRLTGETKMLLLTKEAMLVKSVAGRTSDEGISRIFENIELAKARLNANVSYELTMELMAMAIQEEV